MEKSIFSDEYSIFLQHLRTTRKELGLTQSELGQRLGQTQSFVSKVERGERRLDIVELRRFCIAMNITLQNFILRYERILEP